MRNGGWRKSANRTRFTCPSDSKSPTQLQPSTTPRVEVRQPAKCYVESESEGVATKIQRLALIVQRALSVGVATLIIRVRVLPNFVSSATFRVQAIGRFLRSTSTISLIFNRARWGLPPEMFSCNRCKQSYTARRPHCSCFAKSGRASLQQQFQRGLEFHASAPLAFADWHRALGDD